MFVSLWYYLRGYVIVEVSGYSIDKFIRLAVSNHVVLWRVMRSGDKVYFSTTIQGFKRLKPYVKKARCRMRVTEKRGLPFLSFKYRKRWVFGVGSLFFVIGMYSLCSFVWLVDVVGNDTIDSSNIIQSLEEAGYGTGKFKGSLDLREAETVLMRTYPDIVWTGIEFEGTKMLVRLSEAVPKPELYKKGVPSDMLAKRDTLVTYIVAEKGMPKVRVGDTVKKGERLIAGKIPLEDEGGQHYYTESIGEVKGKTGYSLKASMPLTKIKKHYTGEVANNYSIKLFKKKIPLLTSKKQFDNYDDLITINQLRLTDMFPLPFYFEKSQRVAYIPEQVAVEEEEAKDQLLGALFDQLQKEIGKDAKILKQEVHYTQVEGKLVAELNVIAEENVAIYQKITDEEMLSTQPMETKGVN